MTETLHDFLPELPPPLWTPEEAYEQLHTIASSGWLMTGQESTDTGSSIESSDFVAKGVANPPAEVELTLFDETLTPVEQTVGQLSTRAAVVRPGILRDTACVTLRLTLLWRQQDPCLTASGQVIDTAHELWPDQAGTLGQWCERVQEYRQGHGAESVTPPDTASGSPWYTLIMSRPYTQYAGGRFAGQEQYRPGVSYADRERLALQRTAMIASAASTYPCLLLLAQVDREDLDSAYSQCWYGLSGMAQFLEEQQQAERLDTPYIRGKYAYFRE